uniref:RNA-directed DNA polymerase, eukaryota n=2 Tax=Tanacetum cinerariifolium TaxID=118510 RepID=A0A6L2LLJ3_TANCI|nr:RNA-directed DNA polymerase, eukaryota [Tanacetum cinerariifolium]
MTWGVGLGLYPLSCVLPREDSASFKTWLRFVSRLCCVLSRRPSAFCLKTSAFCLKTKLRFVSRPPAFCLKTYCILSPECKENGVNILKSIDEGPYQMGTVRETLAESTEGAPQFGPERPRHKGESIHNYYVRFAKLINDMRNIKMTMSRLQLNSKFVNNMLPEWGRFVTAVKLNRGLWDSNYDQLYAYLKQHETHAQENKMMLERFSQPTVDPLALMSNVLNPQHYSPSLSPAENLIKNLTNTLALLTQSYKTFLPQTNNQLRTSSDARNQATIQDGKLVVQNVQGRQNRGQGMNPRGGGAAGYGGAQNRVGNVTQGQARPVKCYNCNGVGQIARNCTKPKRPQNSKYYKDKMLLMQAQENGVALDEEQLLFLVGGQDNAFDDDVDKQPVQDLALNVDNVFQDDDCDAFDSDVDEAPTAQTMFMANLSSADPVTDEAGPSYDSNILSEEQVELYERHAKFELTEREQKINEQLRLVISDRNFKEESLKKELHSIKLQLASTINHNKSMVEEVTFLKKDFKQKENKYLEDFLDMKSLKEKVEDRLIKQDQSLQTVHMLCRPKPNYNELNKVAIGYKNPLCLTRAKQVQPALYNGHEIIKDNHAPAIVHNTKDTLEFAEITRKKMNAKMNGPECVTRKVKIAPHDYSKENFLATFTPQKQLTPEQIVWSNDLIKLKFEALKEQTKVSRPIKALTVYPPNTPATVVPKVLPTMKVFSVATNSELNVARFTKMHVTNTIVEARCLTLEAELANLRDKSHHDNQEELINHFSKIEITKLTEQVTNLQAQNDLFRAENDKIKQHYKELYDSIKITRAKHIKKVTNLTTKNVNLKASVSKDKVNPQVLAGEKHAIDVEPIVPRLRNNRDAHLDYLRHLKESVETIHDIVEEAKVVRPFDRVNSCPNASGSQPKSNTKTNRISPAKGVNKLPVEDQSRTNKSHLRTLNRVDSSSRLKSDVINSNSVSVCQTCNKCLTSSNHDMCVATYLKSAMVPPPLFIIIVMLSERPTGRILKLGNQCPLNRFTPPKVVSAQQNKKRANTCANQKEPNQNWGSNFSNSPSLSVFKLSIVAKVVWRLQAICFFQCVLSKQIMRKVSSWWNVDYTDVSSYEEWRVWLVSIRIPNKQKSMMEGVFYGLWWSIWNFRNKLLFDNKTPKKALIFDNLVYLSFNWCKYRCKASFKWDD